MKSNSPKRSQHNSQLPPTQTQLPPIPPVSLKAVKFSPNFAQTSRSVANSSASESDGIQGILDVYTDNILKEKGKFFLYHPTKQIIKQSESFDAGTVQKSHFYDEGMDQIRTQVQKGAMKNVNDLQRFQQVQLPQLKLKKWGKQKQKLHEDEAEQRQLWNDDGSKIEVVQTVFDDLRITDLILSLQEQRFEMERLEEKLKDLGEKFGDVEAETDRFEEKMQNFATAIGFKWTV